MKLDDIISEWKTDVSVKRDYLDEEQARVINLHAKYLEMLSRYRLLLKNDRLLLAELRKKLYEYYNGELNTDKEALAAFGRPPWPRKHMKGEIPMHIEGDADYAKLSRRIIMLEEKVEVLTTILNEIGKRSYQIKNMITWAQLMSGA